VVKEAGEDYDFIIIEGAMSAFTGLLNNNVVRPTSTAEVAAALGVPTILVVSCDKEGVEGAAVSTLNYVNLLKNLGVKMSGVILNKVHTSYLTEDIKHIISQAFEKAGVELVGIVPRIDLEGRGAIPEIEIKYEEFGAKAVETAESSMELEKIAKMAAPATVAHLDYDAFLEKFKNSLTTNFRFNESTEGRGEKCS
jgi:cobyrinic acid a,c-diamide synthase